MGDHCEIYHPLINASYDDRLDIVQRELTAHPEWLNITCEVCLLAGCSLARPFTPLSSPDANNSM